jgi:GT2 family glycosyltransferase
MLSLVRARIIKGVIAVIDSRDAREKERYMEAIDRARRYGLEVIAEFSDKRRGSAKARNRILDIAEQILKGDDILILYDDDYICPGPHAVVPARVWLRDKSIGLVGGRVVNLRRRRADPDFYLNILPGLTDTLTRLTGFIFLDTKHGPRYTDHTTPLMATRIDVIKKGVRYDPNYKGTGYREESDFQHQVRRLGYKIVYEPRFQVFHLCVEEGGNRTIGDVIQRFYWKTRNHTYYAGKHRLGIAKLAVSIAIIIAYAALHGPGTLKAVAKGLREGLSLGSSIYD